MPAFRYATLRAILSASSQMAARCASRQRERRRELDDLLVPALDRAVALEQVDEVPVVVAEDLHLDVLRALDVALEEHGGVAERRARLAPRRDEPLDELALVARDAHAPPAAARARLDDDRVAVLAREDERLLVMGDRLRRAGHDRYARGLRGLAPGDLVAEAALHLRRRPDEDDAGALARLRELGVLGEEAVAGVNRVHLEPLRERDDLLDAEVRVDGLLALADEVRLVRLVAVEREPVLFRVDRDGLDPELGAGAEDADGDLAAVRGHDSLERDGHVRLSSKRTLDAARLRGRGRRDVDVVRCWPPGPA